MSGPIRTHETLRDDLCDHLSFDKILVLDYYDGPRSGVAHCSACVSEYRFDLLDGDIDDATGEDVRIFRLALLPRAAWDELVAVCPDHERARWPIWVPLWRFESDVQRRAADEAVHRVLAEAGPMEFVVASPDGLQTILVCRHVGADAVSNVQDWFQYLGLKRREGAHRA